MTGWAKSVLLTGALLACLPHTTLAADPPKAQVQNAGPYVITLNQSSIDLKSVGAVTITVRKRQQTRNGPARPATAARVRPRRP